jgi:diguanylate cyclase (GGDEF)-like protein/PAS domain S-box-containing protein
MRTPPPFRGPVAFAALAIAAATLLGFAGWPQAERTLEFTGLILAAMLTAAFAMRCSSADELSSRPLSFVVNFTSLLMFGPHATMLVATAGTVTRGLTGCFPPARTLLNVATVLVATQVAGVVHRILGGTMGDFVWPWQAAPIAAAAAAYCFAVSGLSDVVVPFATRQPVDRSWPKSALGPCPTHFIAAAIATGFVELLGARAWPVLPVAAVPLYFLYGAYRDHANRLDAERRRRDVIDFVDQGMAVVDRHGCVTLWDEALERILGCSRARAVGAALQAVLPALRKTQVPKAIEEALASGSPRTLGNVALAAGGDERILHVTIVPGLPERLNGVPSVGRGATLLWRDDTARARAELSLKRTGDRLALAAEGANDGLWEWDLRTQEVYFSRRWREMIGLFVPAGVGRPEDWLGRVHADDIDGLKKALEAHLSGKVNHFQYEHRIRHENGTYRRFLCRGVAVRGAQRRAVRIAGSLTDTTEQAIAQEQLRSAGFLDPLTGLCNRSVFVEGLGRILDEFKQRRGSARFAVLYLDLDRFKIVNDSLGHLIGDELLIAVSRRLESCLRPGDALARLGGDEFAILLNGLNDEGQANAIAFRIQESLSAPFSLSGREVFTSASIGIAVGSGQYANPDEIMRDADIAMYHAKSRGKARHELFDADMHARTRDRLGLENDLRHAVHNHDLEVHYQPIVSLDSAMCVGFESLVRWTRNGEAVSPATFIPIAEELGLIEPLGTWVMQQACCTFADWKRRFPDRGLDCITVNVSSRQLMQQGFLRIVEQAVNKAGLKPCDLRVEITETALMDSPNEVAGVLRELRAFGVKIYLDDFGTGYSSLSHLHKLPVDALKIDRSFVKSLLLPDRPAIVESILALARTLNTSVVAEGIESEVQARELERLGCTHAQGFLFSRPLSTRAVETLMVANRPLGPEPESRAESEVSHWSIPFDWSQAASATVDRAGSKSRLTGEHGDLARA